MQRYFGTDGVRARINSGPMTAENIIRLALAAGAFHIANRKQDSRLETRPMVVIGKDTRLSGYMVESALQAGFASIGMDTRLLGPMPTPGVAYLTRTLRADLGVMISASHNPAEDNGIKLFGPEGFKLLDEEEDEISRMIAGHIPLAAPLELGRARRVQDGVGRYLEAVKASLPGSLRLDGMKVVIDCANGAAYLAAPVVLAELGAQVIPIATEPDGTNINQQCGAVMPQAMQQAVIDNAADIGIALDGDADRLIMADEQGALIDGDQTLAVIAEHLAETGTLRGGAVVGTLMSNHALGRWLEDKDIQLERTAVGDRYILERMRQADRNLGGEPSGHILMTDHGTTGDGLMAGLAMLARLAHAGAPASQALRRFVPLPQVIVNVEASSAEAMRAVMKKKAVQSAVRDAEAELATAGRVVLRPSGTEPLIRVMVEAEDAGLMQQLADQLAGVIRHGLEDQDL